MKEYACPVLCCVQCKEKKQILQLLMKKKKLKWVNLSDNYCNNSPSFLRTKSKEINVGAFECTLKAFPPSII